MPRAAEGEERNLAELLQDILIADLGRAGVRQAEIRKIVRCDMNRVSRIVKHIERERKRIGKEKSQKVTKIEKKLDIIIQLSRRSGRS